MSMLLALDNLAAPLVGAPLSWRQSLTGAQFGALFGKLLFKVFIFTLVLCGYIWAANTWAPSHAPVLLLPVLPLLVLVGVPLCYAYVKLLSLRLRGLNLSPLWLMLLYPAAEGLRIASMAALDVLARHHYILVSITAYSLQRSFMFLALVLMAVPSPKKTGGVGAVVTAHPQYFYIAYFFIAAAMLGVFFPGPLQFGLNISLSLTR